MILKCEKYLVTYKSLKMDAAEFLIENPYWFSWVCAQEIMCNPLGSIQLFSLQLCKCRSWICTFVIMVLTLLTRPLSRSWFYAKRKRPFSGQRAVFFFFILRGNLLLWSSINRHGCRFSFQIHHHFTHNLPFLPFPPGNSGRISF